MYAILPAAGYGTRFLPWTKAVPKELLPVGDRPVIHGVVEEAVAAGIQEIVLVISEGKEAILRYFESDPDLEAHLKGVGKADLLSDWQTLVNGLTFHVVYQHEMKGLGHAIRCGLEQVPEGQASAVLLPDTLIRGTSPLGEMVQTLQETGCGSVAVEPVSEDRAVKYGICGGREVRTGAFELDQMIEKPAPEQIPRMHLLSGETAIMAFAARYVFPPSLREVLDRTPPGKNGEIQLTDAMSALLETEGFHAYALQGVRQDIGTPEGLAQAFTTLSP